MTDRRNLNQNEDLISDFMSEDLLEFKQPYLLVLSCPNPALTGILVDLSGPQCTLGSSDTADFSTESISERHAQVIREDSELVLYDLGSDNGTYVNGDIVRKAYLEPGDIIGLGHDTVLKYTILDSTQVDAEVAFARRSRRLGN